MEIDDVRELRQLRQENARLKKVLAERDLEVEGMKELQAKKWYAHDEGGKSRKRRVRVAQYSAGGVAVCHAPLRGE